MDVISVQSLEQPLEVDEGDDGALCRELRGVEEGPDKAVDLPVLGVVLVILRVHRVALKSLERFVESFHNQMYCSLILHFKLSQKND